MPTGIYLRTKYHRQIISESHKGHKHSEATKVKLSEKGKLLKFGKWNLGKHHTEEAKRKIGIAFKGRTSPTKGMKFSEATKRKMRETHLKHGLCYTREYQKAYSIKRRMLTKVLDISTIQKVYENNIKQYGTLTCYLCLKEIPFGKDTLEHRIPLSRGGSSEYDNLNIACLSCNSRKNNKTVGEYWRYIMNSNMSMHDMGEDRDTVMP